MRQLKYWVFFLLGSWLVLTLMACDRVTENDKQQAAISKFMAEHWPAVIPPQGNPPAGYTPQESSLGSMVCGECHAAQFEQWRTSLHSHSMGPGIQWQLQLMTQEQGNKCLQCHAPLAEQKALVALQHQWPNAPDGLPPAWVTPDLADAGLVCASCHVRRHQRFGPPPRQATPGELPHGGFSVSNAFQDSRFCAPCHQFPDDGPRVNGKLKEDTWEQWRQSPQASQGLHCQNCHMPDRQHLWKGIHDLDMTRQALDVQLKVQRTAADAVIVEALLHNRGAGHHFPTYMVPKVTLAFSLRNRETAEERVFHRHIIGWQVNVALTEEEFDTRIPAGDMHRLQLPVKLPGADGLWEIAVSIDVAPREHYERTFRQSLKHADRIPALTLATLRQALREAEASRYQLLQLNEIVPSWPIAN